MRALGVLTCAAAATLALGAQPQRRQLHICHAGSLSAAFADVSSAFAAQHPGVDIDDVSGGSVALARRLATGAQACDVYASADYVDIDVMMKPAKIADYTIRFAHGRMVLAYVAADPAAQGIAEDNWYRKVTAPGVRIAGAHPFLDPGGYRSHLMFELAERVYRIPGLYNAMLERYVSPSPGTIGKDYDFQFIYEHSAAAIAKTNRAYRYIHLPEAVDLSEDRKNAEYGQARVTIPGLGRPRDAAAVTIPATRVVWGLTIPRSSANVGDAVAFVTLLFGPAGTAALNAHGPAPMTPPVATRADAALVPGTLGRLAIE